MHSATPLPAHLVRQAREARRLNQVDFAAELGKSQAVLSRYETGKVDPPTVVLMQCMHILRPPSSPSLDAAVTTVRDALDTLRLALDTLQRAAVLTGDTAANDAPHSPVAGESKVP